MSWLIYKHTNLINGKVYIGQSKYSWPNVNDRWQDGRGYGKHTRLGMAIAKYGWNNFSHELVEDCIESQELPNEREIFWIKKYNSYSEGYNCTIGGKNIPIELNYKLSIYCYENKQSYNSIMEASQLLNVSYHQIQRQLTTGHYYKNDKYRFCVDSEKQSFKPVEYKIKYDFTHIKRNIICIETKEIFDSITDCSNATGISTQNLSQNCCKNHRTAKGRHYAYLEEYDEYWTPAEEYGTDKRKRVSTLKKSVYCLQTNKFYSSATECASELGINAREVSRCAAKDSDVTQTHGYNFCYAEDYYEGWQPREKKKTTYVCTSEIKEKMRKSNWKCKKVLCIETGLEYYSASEAGRQTGISKDSIINVCNKKPHCNTAGGYHWKYVSE